MVLDGHVFTVPDGVRGFDANLIIPPNAAAAFIQRGYRFCVRYVRRQTVHDFDLTPDEADGLIGAGWVSWWCSTSSRRLRGPRPPPRARRTATLPRPKRNRLGSRPVGWSGATSRASQWERPRRRSSTTAIGGTRRSPARDTCRGYTWASTAASMRRSSTERCASATIGARTTLTPTRCRSFAGSR